MVRNIISERGSELPVSTMGKLISIAAEDKSVISLGPGEPDFDSPKNVIRAAKRSLDRGYTHYSPPAGRLKLREAIAKKLSKENGVKATPNNVIVTSGSTEGILLALMNTIDPGEGVIITDPGFLAYKPAIELLNGVPISIPLKEEEGFQLSVDRMQDMVIPEKTNAMILNTPMNPTGTVLSKKTLEEVADFAVENEILVISDEAYEKLVYSDAKHISIGSLNGMEDHVITLQTFSKTYAMPGFRVGYACGPDNIIKSMSKLHIFSSISAPTVSQMAALEALKGPQGAVGRMVKEYDRRRKMVIRRLKSIPNFFCMEPKGAFYAFPNISEFGMSSLDFAKFLLEKAKVATVPGTEFGSHGEGYIRISYATEYGKIEEALDRIDRVVSKI
ncbi:MAG: pyridoxal phosphate-dependent aminotransferase [Candidatus Aenigmatarchaeota archaeon]|nr:MAG: pyridoxal phosphate-dependent aminotransferase [Candidatus Aenigmarchaeota archaeon]